MFHGTVEEIASQMSSDLHEGALAKRLKDKGHEVITEARIEGFEHDPDNLARKLLAEKMFDLALELDLHASQEEVQSKIRQVSLHLASIGLEEPTGGKELVAVQSVRALDDMDKVIDRLGQRLREWFLAEYPAFTDDLPEPKDMAETISSRYPWTTSQVHKDNLEKIQKALSSSEEEASAEALKSLASRLADLFVERQALEDLTTATVKEVAPNLTEVAGPVLTARLVSEAGTLSSLAKMSTTTVQILGAKRAVFRHLRSGDRPPKHGLIFIHPYVSTAKPWQRGKIAKTIAAILSRAARADAFGEVIAGHHLKKELEEKVERIKAERLEPPVKRSPRPRPRGDRPQRRPMAQRGHRQGRPRPKGGHGGRGPKGRKKGPKKRSRRK